MGPEKNPRKLFDLATQVYFQTNQFEKHEIDVTKLERNKAAKTFTRTLYFGTTWVRLYTEKLQKLNNLLSSLTTVSKTKFAGLGRLKETLTLLFAYVNQEVKDCQTVLCKAMQVFLASENLSDLKDATQLVRHAAEIYWECEKLFRLIKRSEETDSVPITLVETVAIFNTWPRCSNPKVKRPRKERFEEVIIQAFNQ